MKKNFTEVFAPWHQKNHLLLLLTLHVTGECVNHHWGSADAAESKVCISLGWTNSPALNPLKGSMRSLRPSWLLRASGQVWCPLSQGYKNMPPIPLWLKPQHHPTVCSIQVLPALPCTFLLLTGTRELLWAGWSTAISHQWQRVRPILCFQKPDL